MSEAIERYRLAERLLDDNVADLVLNETIDPQWCPESSAFWYRRRTKRGCEYVFVDEHGTRGPAFDHSGLASLVGDAVGQAVEPDQLDVIAIEGTRIVVCADQLRVCCDLNRNTGVIVEQAYAPPHWLVSPDGRNALAVRGYDLVLIDCKSRIETAITDSGEDGFAWGKLPDSWLKAVPRQSEGQPSIPFGWCWSPDSRLLVGGRVDERRIAKYPLLQSVPDEGFRPKVWWVRQPLVGEEGGLFHGAVIDVETGLLRTIQIPENVGKSITAFEPLAWAPDGTRFWVAVVLYEDRSAVLLEVDTESATARIVLEERAAGFISLNPLLYNMPNVRIIRQGREVVWYSERSGWGHLYRYDLQSGRLLGALTEGDWLVRDIIQVDHEREQIYFAACGRGADPYHRQLMRVGFDGGATLLTPEDADHLIEGVPAPLFANMHGTPNPPQIISPDGRVFVDCYSTVTAPGASLLRSSVDGALITELERADASALEETGWRAPEPFVVKAADGITDLYGVVYRPLGDAESPAPIVDALYAGPQLITAPHNFRAARAVARGGYGRNALAALGFAVVVVDGRGTPFRSKAFHDLGYGNFADLALEDHVAVLRQLVSSDTSLDGERIGVIGHSFGGYVAARALLRFPDVYKVSVSAAGSHNIHGMYRDVHMYFPPPTYGGTHLKPTPSSIPSNYRLLDNASLASNLKGKILLVYGDLDENAYPAVTLQLIDALIKADRPFDLLYLPNRNHHFKSDDYFVRRSWDYLSEHLLSYSIFENRARL